MSADPYTLEGARRILADRPQVLERLDRLLGAAILGSGVAGAAAGVPLLGLVFGWVDQKNELIRLLDGLVSAGHQRLRAGERRQRHEVLAATHTALVHGAFFEALREVIGPVHERLEITAEDRARMADAVAARAVEVPMPDATAGLGRNLRERVPELFRELTGRCLTFFAGLDAWRREGAVRSTDPLVEQIVDRATRRYQAEFVRLATDVREFEIWALLGEHAAAGASLSRLERLVGGIVSGPAGQVRDILGRLNRDVLAAPLIPVEETGDLAGVRLPTVEAGYVSPRFRWTIAGDDARPSSEEWWAEQPVETDLDTFLAAHFASPASVDRPLVVLGHPGSGKSLFTKVCAARLSSAGRFTAVRVALRDVADPTAPVYQQVEEPLRHATHGRVTWPGLCDAAADTVRVLFVDGLDELMQATGATQSGYLAGVAEFQRVEKVTGNPVAVVVTARTIVADLARIPAGSLVVKLDDFSDDQVRRWLGVWHAANAGGPARDLDPDEVIGLGDLSHQPLLLLLVAIFGAANPLPAGSAADLYDALLHDFLTRELSKPGQPAGRPAQRRREALWQLGVVAFGMLNRGRLHITEDQLRRDLAALSRRGAGGDPDPVPAGGLSDARRIIGRFFFVTAAEAAGGTAGRSYEFLHATFGEYLVAQLLADELAGLHRARERPSSQQWDDDLLFALLSHRLVAARGSRVLTFLRQLVDARDEAERDGVLDVLGRVVAGALDRWGRGAFGAYDPSGGRYLDRSAMYTANLALLLVHLSPEPVPAGAFGGRWAELLDLWRGTLGRFDRESWTVLLESFDRDAATGAIRAGVWAGDPEFHHLWLATGSTYQGILRAAGRSVLEPAYAGSPLDQEEQLAGRLTNALIDPFGRGRFDVDGTALAELADHERRDPLLFRPATAFLCRYGDAIPTDQLERMTRLLAEWPAARDSDDDNFGLLLALFPWLLDPAPGLRDRVFTEVNGTRRPRSEMVGVILGIGEVVWGERRRSLYGVDYAGALDAMLLRSVGVFSAIGRVPSTAGKNRGARCRAIIRDAALMVDNFLRDRTR